MSHKKQTRSNKNQALRQETAGKENVELNSEDEFPVHVGEMQEDALKRIEKQLEKLSMLDMLQASIEKTNTLINSINLKLKEHETRITATEESAQQLHMDVTQMKTALSEKASLRYMEKLEDKIEDLENRSRRNNIILYNIPENSEERPSDCASFVQSFIHDFMKVTSSEGSPIEVERAHRGRGRNDGKPPPIFARILNWKERQGILREAPRILKEKRYNDLHKIGITDDVSQKERQKRKELMPQREKLRKEGKYAIIPFKVPAVLIYKDEYGHFKTIHPT